ncbi:rRNA methyltransferase 3, mitochondrial [Drosophila albomicans]|uniref:rRNA methyltransferase 3, mitochondrial n=1 Tax=Drosophila albomicans TaxID=7291 RepID=A0A6P8YDA0_DROAB|nr:rRNA methyltransferase 3, mitochondrial [Drosophila albomicans]
MFLNIIRRTVQSNIKNVNYNVLRYSSSAGPKDEIKDALDIEASLFENSLLKHEPVSTRDALRKHKTSNTRQKKQSATKSAAIPSTSIIKSTVAKNAVPPIKRDPAPLIKDSELNLEFTRLSLQDPLMSTLLTEVRSRKRRDKNNQIIIEGRRLIAEALQSGLRMKSLFFSQKDQLALLREPVAQAQEEHKTKIYKVPQHDLKTWSSLVTPPGLMALFERPSLKGVEQQQSHAETLPITVVCDNIREPNNLGSIIRTCAALPCSQVVVTHGCCDPWESKALRGGCGGQFRLPIHDDVKWEQLALHIPPETADDCHVFIAENNLEKLKEQNGVAIEYADLQNIGAHNILIIGGESHGVSEDAYKFMELVGNRGKCVYIPLAKGIDSLNVASALTLLLFELRRKLIG